MQTWSWGDGDEQKMAKTWEEAEAKLMAQEHALPFKDLGARNGGRQEGQQRAGMGKRDAKGGLEKVI